MTIAVLFADSHLSMRTWAHKPIEQDSFVSMSQIVEFAVDRSIPLVGAGDLLDRSINKSSPVVQLSRLLDRLRDGDSHMYFIQGQHEMSPDPWMNVGGDVVTHIHQDSVELDGFHFYGIDFQPAEEMHKCLDSVPGEVDVLVMHQVWSDFMGEIGSPQGGFHDLPDVNMLITGDYHVNQCVKARNKTGEVTEVLSPGSTHMRSIDEPADKFFFTFEGDGSWKRYQLATRCKLVWPSILTDEDAMEDFLQGVDKYIREGIEEWSQSNNDNLEMMGLAGKINLDPIRDPLFRVRYSGAVSDVVSRIKSRLKSIDTPIHLFLKEIPPDKQDRDSSGQRASRSGTEGAETMESLLPVFLSDIGASDLEPYADRLLRANDVTAELEKMKSEVLKKAS